MLILGHCQSYSCNSPVFANNLNTEDLTKRPGALLDQRTFKDDICVSHVASKH